LDSAIEANAMANLLMCFVTGRWHQFAKSGFKRMPTELWSLQWSALGLGSATPATQESP
jgi:TetR/AcrR family transcriptional regulator